MRILILYINPIFFVDFECLSRKTAVKLSKVTKNSKKQKISQTLIRIGKLENLKLGNWENWEFWKVIAIGEKYGKSAGQILIKFQVQRKIAVIPKDCFQYDKPRNSNIAGISGALKNWEFSMSLLKPAYYKNLFENKKMAIWFHVRPFWFIVRVG